MPHLTSDDAQLTIRRQAGRLLICWTAADSATFGDLKTSFRAHFSHARWDAEAKAWAIRRTDESNLRYWLWVTIAPDAVTWDDAGEAPRERQSTAVSSVDQAYRVLHLLPSAPPELVKAAHRALSKLHHPDLGGDTAVMAALNRAVELIDEHRTVGAA